MVLVPITTATGATDNQSKCCNYNGIRCNKEGKCEIPNNEQQQQQQQQPQQQLQNDCVEVCSPQRRCSWKTMLKCAGKIAACVAQCTSDPTTASCVACLGGSWGLCHKCFHHRINVAAFGNAFFVEYE